MKNTSPHTITCPKCGHQFPLTEAFTRQLRSELEEEMQNRLKSELATLTKQFQEKELLLLKQQQQLQQEKEQIELTVQRRLTQERHQITQEIRQTLAEEHRLLLSDKELIIQQLRQQIQELKTSATRSNITIHGKSLEITLAQDLRSAFPQDTITDTPTGTRGADIRQDVFTPTRQHCGTILWETKRAQRWSNDWPQKLKNDQRNASAELAVIVTTALPPNTSPIAQHQGIWICTPNLAAALATALRHSLITTHALRLQHTSAADKAQQLYQYLCSTEFRQQFEAIVETFIALEDQLHSEKRALNRQWKIRETQLKKAITHTAHLYGSIQGIAGRDALPTIKHLALLPH